MNQRPEKKQCRRSSRSNPGPDYTSNTVRSDLADKLLFRLMLYVGTIEESERSRGGRSEPDTDNDLKEVTEEKLDSKHKRSWQFAAVGRRDSSPTRRWTTNNTRTLAPISSTSAPRQCDDLETVQMSGRTYHAETRLASNGCRDIVVSGGHNCIFCTLYLQFKGERVRPHFNQVRSWVVPPDASNAMFPRALFEDLFQDVTNRNIFNEWTLNPPQAHRSIHENVQLLQRIVDFICNYSRASSWTMYRLILQQVL